jgi:hypothetical protein
VNIGRRYGLALEHQVLCGAGIFGNDTEDEPSKDQAERFPWKITWLGEHDQ